MTWGLLALFGLVAIGGITGSALTNKGAVTNNPESHQAKTLIGGTTAENVDYFASSNWLPIVFAFVLGLSFILLTLVFRSIVVPPRRSSSTCSRSARPTACSCWSSRTASGTTCSGFQQVDAIEAWVPVFLFSVLFGLSMDYHVFLLSRIQERYAPDRRHHRRSVALGMRRPAASSPARR